MSIFQRVADLIDANLNALLDKVENPEVMLDKYLADMDKEYAETEALVAKSIASRNLTQKKFDDESHAVETWEKNAILAVEKGNDDLAKKALNEQLNAERSRDALKKELDQQNIETEKLKSLLSKLESKIDEAKSKRDLLVTQATNAQTTKKIAEVSSKLSGSDSTKGFAKMEDKVNRMVAEAEAATELSGQSLEAQFEALKADQEDTAVDDKLAALKAKMNK